MESDHVETGMETDPSRAALGPGNHSRKALSQPHCGGAEIETAKASR